MLLCVTVLLLAATASTVTMLWAVRHTKQNSSGVTVLHHFQPQAGHRHLHFKIQLWSSMALGLLSSKGVICMYWWGSCCWWRGGDKAWPVPDRWCVRKAEMGRASGAERVKPLWTKAWFMSVLPRREWGKETKVRYCKSCCETSLSLFSEKHVCEDSFLEARWSSGAPEGGHSHSSSRGCHCPASAKD